MCSSGYGRQRRTRARKLAARPVPNGDFGKPDLGQRHFDSRMSEAIIAPNPMARFQ
jgi:hypothetical protein